MEEILNKMFEVAKEKRISIHSQQYETAARLRDNQKDLENELFKNIFIDKNIIPGYSRKYDSLEKYFLENYNVQYSELFNEDTFTQVKREMILRKLGI